MPDAPRGNFVSEWFGYRTFPLVRGGEVALRHQGDGVCPFLTMATGEDALCVKRPASSGVCSISAESNGRRQDWLVCPYRVLDPELLERIVKNLFGDESDVAPVIVPAPSLSQQAVRDEFEGHVREGALAVTYFQDERSPEFSFDVTLIEAVPRGDSVGIGRFGILEIQTMDFHGSYRDAVANLKDSLRLHREGFPAVLQKNQRWLAENIEGPNIANVFKRTFYQMMLKFEAGSHPDCTGTVLAIPQAVWDSWQRHLGKPTIEALPDGTHRLAHEQVSDPGAPAWIYVFDIDLSTEDNPAPLTINQTIATDAASLARHALREVPAHAFSENGGGLAVMETIRRRLARWWPGIAEVT